MCEDAGARGKTHSGTGTVLEPRWTRGGTEVEPWWIRSGTVVEPPMKLVEPGSRGMPMLCVFAHPDVSGARPTPSFIKLIRISHCESRGVGNGMGLQGYNNISRTLPKPCLLEVYQVTGHQV